MRRTLSYSLEKSSLNTTCCSLFFKQKLHVATDSKKGEGEWMGGGGRGRGEREDHYCTNEQQTHSADITLNCSGASSSA